MADTSMTKTLIGIFVLFALSANAQLVPVEIRVRQANDVLFTDGVARTLVLVQCDANGKGLSLPANYRGPFDDTNFRLFVRGQNATHQTFQAQPVCRVDSGKAGWAILRQICDYAENGAPIYCSKATSAPPVNLFVTTLEPCRANDYGCYSDVGTSTNLTVSSILIHQPGHPKK